MTGNRVERERREKRETNLLNKAAIDVLVELLEQLGGHAAPGKANGRSLEEEVAAGVGAIGLLAVNDGEGAKARKNQVLQDLGPHRARVDQADLGGLKSCLAVLTPQTGNGRKKKERDEEQRRARTGRKRSKKWRQSSFLLGFWPRFSSGEPLNPPN